MNNLHLTHLQISIKSCTGSPVELDLRYNEREIKTYRALIAETLEGLGLQVDCIALGYDNLPPGVQMVPIVPVKPTPPVVPEPEVDVSELAQYKNKPRMSPVGKEENGTKRLPDKHKRFSL